MALDLTAASFDQHVTNAEGLVLVDFWAPWCGPCKMMAPIVDEVAQELPNVTIGKVNVDEASDLAMQYNILSIPTFVLFKNGQVIDQFSGAMGKDALKDRIVRHQS